MKKLLFMLGIALCSVAIRAQDPSTPQMATYQFVILKRGPNAAGAETPEGQQTLVQHVQHLYKLGNEGVIRVAGPFTDGGDIQGVIVLEAPTAERAMEIEGADPAVKAGIFTMEALPLYLQDDSFGKWAEFGKFQRVYFGFLVRGANRNQDEKTAERLQEQHIAFMESQAKAGRLVMAGPFMSDEDRRGIVVYIAASAEDARKIAEGDPMIKIGRLAVELHPWQVPAGSIAKLKTAP